MSYTNNAQVVWDASTDANFRAPIQFIHNAFTGTGSNWTQTADTGQLNPATITAPAQNAYATGYLIYKSNDALASTFALYVKFEFGANNNATKGVGIRVSFGTGSDGAGNLTGASVVVVGATGTAVSSTSFTGAGATAGTGSSTWDSYASLDTGRAGFLLWRNHSSTSAPSAFCIERSLDSTGAYTSAYFTVAVMGNNSSGTQMWHIFKPGTGGSLQIGTSATNTSGFPTVHNTATSLIFGSNAPMSPIFPLIGRVDNPLTAFGAVKTGDQSESAQFAATVYGTSHNYVYTKAGLSLAFDSSANWGLAMRYE